MATDFYKRQDRARRNTSFLVLLFALAVIGIVGAVSAVTYFVLVEQQSTLAPLAGGYDAMGRPESFRWDAVVGAGVLTLAVILGASAVKGVQLRSGGGAGVAEHLGGMRLYPNSGGVVEQRLLNVVEEMALASGVPVPPVYLLEDEQGINAFAAGYSPSDAVVGVTRGCAETLSRDELQGVIAHEFSHILNGDMRLNIRMIGYLQGILLLGLIGQWLFRAFIYSGGGSRRSNSRGSGGSGGSAILVVLAVSLALIVLGALGSFMGGLIKAAISREREYLADASAVQFTRNPGGIGGALKRIGAAVTGGRLKAPAAAEASHMFFATGVWEGLSGLTATHPPLEKRILAIEPDWNGVFPETPAAGQAASAVGAAGAMGFSGGLSVAAAATVGAAGRPAEGSVPLDVVDHAAEHIGAPTREHRSYAQRLIESLPEELIDAAHEPFGARAVIYGLLLDRDPAVRKAQLAGLAQGAEAPVRELMHKLLPAIDAVDHRARLPLVDMTLPALKSLSTPQYVGFGNCLRLLVEADQRLGLFEWTLGQVLSRHLRPQYEKVRAPAVQYYGLQKLGAQVAQVLSTLAYVGGDDTQASAAFSDASCHFPELDVRLLPRDQCSLTALRGALDTLTHAAPKQRGRVVDACAAAICTDGEVTLREAELLRGVSDLLDCPMPPLLAGQKVAP
ncbi:hypothetical protein Pla175_05310 [Pirellulimonas nuda]|uniref:Peptidase M48 domain-containing protein n=1 Tax=Pirellulimonas nuda TaxID=2528009 RepID=A0A518D6U4_9BACT|nr:M48 family metallopeptidase [Pirellulimonas nuda]QDU87175.1 hypothetical protein Pla175_05310 [Pirellulimonas nuda]